MSEYLNTAYSPDCDYVDGEVLERNMGEHSHAKAQFRAGRILSGYEESLGVEILVEQRVQVTPTRFRIPDVCVLAPGAPYEEIIKHPPLLCIEILSKDDAMSRIMEKVEEYLAMGVPNVWIVDPWRRRGYHCTRDGMHDAADGVLRTSNPELVVALADLFD